MYGSAGYLLAVVGGGILKVTAGWLEVVL